MDIFESSISIEELANVLPAFTIEKPIGAGGQGTVFLVRLQDGRKGALKIYRLSRIMASRVEREINALEKLDSDVIVTLISYGNILLKNEECKYVVSEYIEGTDLRRLINQGPLDEQLVIQLCYRISQAIDELWTLRIVHRDIKPENILIDNNGLPYLIDLGIAKHLDQKTLTAVGRTLGTLGYMSPEQMAGRRGLTLKSDLFSLGIVAYEALTGKHPFDRNQNLVGKINPPPINEILSVKPELAEVINEMLQLHPADRPSSGKVIRERLSSIIDILEKGG